MDIIDALRDNLKPQGELRPLCVQAAAEIERLRSWMYEAINSLDDPQDACDHQDSEEAALRATIAEAIGKLRTGLGDEQQERRAALDALTEHDQALGLYDNEQNGGGKCP